MKNSISYLLWMGFLIVACHLVDEKKPNILFVISDDQSYPHAGIYGTEWVNTPGFDRVARRVFYLLKLIPLMPNVLLRDPLY